MTPSATSGGLVSSLYVVHATIDGLLDQLSIDTPLFVSHQQFILSQYSVPDVTHTDLTVGGFANGVLHTIHWDIERRRVPPQRSEHKRMSQWMGRNVRAARYIVSTYCQRRGYTVGEGMALVPGALADIRSQQAYSDDLFHLVTMDGPDPFQRIERSIESITLPSDETLLVGS